MSKYHIPDNESEQEVLPNKMGITEKEEIGREEAKGFARAEVILLEELTEGTTFDVEYIIRIHELALGHLYEFAGSYRTVNISKGEFMFPAAKVLHQAMEEFAREMLAELPHQYQDASDLVRDIGRIHSELLYIHPFREGNGRTARILANMMAYKAGYEGIDFQPIATNRKKKGAYIRGVQEAVNKNYEPMIKLIDDLLSTG